MHDLGHTQHPAGQQKRGGHQTERPRVHGAEEGTRPRDQAQQRERHVAPARRRVDHAVREPVAAHVPVGVDPVLHRLADLPGDQHRAGRAQQQERGDTGARSRPGGQLLVGVGRRTASGSGGDEQRDARGEGDEGADQRP